MSIATILASLVHVILMMVNPGVWAAISGTVILVSCLYRASSNCQLTVYMLFFVMLTGGVEAAVSIIVCSMSVIIPAILRALDVGDPFMREDSVDLNFSSSIDITRTDTSGIELGLSIPPGMAITDSDDSEGPMASRQRHSVDLGVKDDRKQRLTAQASDGSLGNSKTVKILPLIDECDITDSLAHMRSTPAAATDRDIEANIEEEQAKRSSI